MMGDLSRYFSRSEWECFCGCGGDTVDSELVFVLEGLRMFFGGATVTITPKGGFRCRHQNTLSEGAEDSQHLTGRAADIKVDGIHPKQVYEYLVNMYPGQYGIGLYKTFVHIDTRSNGPARWEV